MSLLGGILFHTAGATLCSLPWQYAIVKRINQTGKYRSVLGKHYGLHKNVTGLLQEPSGIIAFNSGDRKYRLSLSDPNTGIPLNANSLVTVNGDVHSLHISTDAAVRQVSELVYQHAFN